jgi:AraC-like DNA-binding protein
MSYFDDIQFIAAGESPRCAAVVDQRYPKSYATQFVLSGKMYFGINGGPRTPLTPPAAFWHHPRNSYHYAPLPGAHWHHFWVMFKGGRGRRILEDGFMKLSPDGWIAVRRPVEYAAHFKRLVDIVRNERPRRHAEATALLEAMLALLTTHREPPLTEDTEHRPAIERCAAAVRINPNQNHNFQLAAREAHLSYSHFRRLFSEYIGHSPHEYLLLCRMQRAALQLQKGTQIKDVAVDAGYPDYAQFSHLFKKKIGLPPRDYRSSTVL